MNPLQRRKPVYRRPTSDFNIVHDGNSLTAGIDMTMGMTMPQQVARSAPITGSGAALSSKTNSGWTWLQMQSQDGAAVDAAWVSGKTNILVIWETTNSLATGRTVQQAYDDAKAYITARRAANPWIIIVLTTIPRQNHPDAQQANNDLFNANLLAVDALMKSQVADLGADYILDVRRAGSPFAFTAYTPADFNAIQQYWVGTTGRVHLNNVGMQIISGYVSEMLSTIRTTMLPHQ